MLEAALEHRAFRLLRRVEARLAKDVGAGRTSAEAWNRALVEVRQLFRMGYSGWFEEHDVSVGFRSAFQMVFEAHCRWFLKGVPVVLKLEERSQLFQT